jgi:NTP pyrophosphatase (non-canonical NTP hydrolase)
MPTQKDNMTTLYEYEEWTANTCAQLTTSELDDVHMLFGMMTEVGELVDVFKKNMAYGKEIDWFNVEEEIGDLMFYIASFCRMNDLDLQEIIETNIAKLETRYPEKFSKEKALNRNLNKERAILEGN